MSTTTIDKSSDRVRTMFGEIAPSYDRMNHLLSLNVDRYWRRVTVRRLKPVAGEPILDLCTGTGDLAIAFYRATGGKSQIVGADFCPQMLEIARRKGERVVRGGTPIEWVEADAQQLPFESDRFAIVSVAFGLRNVADTDRGLAEMARVCAKSGQVAVLEFSEPTWQPFKAIYGWYFRNVLPRIGQWLARNRSNAYDYLPASVGEFPYGEALAERMRGAGLTSVRYWPLTGGIATLYVGVKPAA
ncbi:MAG TPA: bifunctional demethylmenaquinone methyltransferase/2-methoxy-6-polyprenyl-1,4-benzoquinol methylase UbiE [Pirellulaceae bacterium]|nr:bifunctional demethylmenaquinone methyltransferase/2-methoxy-6-polyprenyl-1,4-benzoquinol methylase UbiE [Pirellulaceae bacterium]